MIADLQPNQIIKRQSVTDDLLNDILGRQLKKDT